MKNKRIVLVPLATALASLSATSANANTHPANTAEPADTRASVEEGQKLQPNAIFSAGDELFGMLVTTSADGTVVAQHSSHYSHSSHSSHRSHSSSRY